MWKLSAGFFLILVLGAPTAALGCSCIQMPSPQESAQSSDAVFIAKITRIGYTWSYGEPVLEVQFQPERSFKGLRANERVLFTGREGSMCGYTSFVTGQRFLIYADRQRNQLTTSLCTRTAPVDRSTQREVDELSRHFTANPQNSK